MQRRDFINIGGLTLAGLSLPNIEIEAQEKNGNKPSVIMLFLAGGMSHAESFTAAPDAVGNFRSVTGYLKTKSGFHLGGHWEKLAELSPLYSVVPSFTHINPGHQGGTHYVQTGYNLNDENQGAPQNHPSYGSILSNTFGANSEPHGMPTYVALNRVYGQGAAFLGNAYGPLALDGEGKSNLSLNVPLDRFLQRKFVLEMMDKKFNARVDKNIELYKKQGYNILLGKVKEAFESEKEPESIKKLYGESNIAKQLMLARRLVENGVRFISVVHGGWDMHTDIKQGMERLVPEVDHAIACLITDLKSKGLLDNTMVVVATEFGRTPINKDAGRDHYARTTPLLLAGGKYIGGNSIGQVDKNGFEVTEKAYAPIDLLQTVLDHVGIEGKSQVTDLSGRPRYLVEGTAKVIS